MLAWFLPPVLGVVKGTFYSHPVHHSLGGVLAGFVKRSLGDCLEDFSMVMLTPLLLLLLIVPPGRISPRVRRIVLYGFALAFGAPALFEAVGHFAFYYSYLRWVPAVLVLFAAASDLWARNESGPPRWLAFGFGLTLAAAVAVGLPLRLGLALACGRLVPRTEIQNLLRSRITPQDTAFSEYLPFFEVKQIAPVVYDLYSSPALSSTGVPGLDLTTKTKQAVSVMVIRPEERERLGAFFGGQWQPVGGPFGDTQDFGFLTRIPIVGRRFVSYSLQPQNERYQLQVFRRAAAQPPDTRDRDGK